MIRGDIYQVLYESRRGLILAASAHEIEDPTDERVK